MVRKIDILNTLADDSLWAEYLRESAEHYEDELKRDLLGAAHRIEQLEEQHLDQIKRRLPVYISDHIDSWPRCLTAVSKLKSDNNNMMLELLELEADKKALQARIDELMLEYCEDEMSEEQLANWAAYQRSVPERTSNDPAKESK